MLCQKCNDKQATVHFVKIINGVRTEMHLCEKCAPKVNQNFPTTDIFDITVSDIMNSFFGSSLPSSSTKCSICGTTFDSFSQSGKLGCSGCYDAFDSQLKNPLKRIHGGVQHVGKTPKRAGDGIDKITKLKKQLEDAIITENFEKAASIRDEIRKLEGGNSQ